MNDSISISGSAAWRWAHRDAQRYVPDRRSRPGVGRSGGGSRAGSVVRTKLGSGDSARAVM
jgi:hypothetical protein